jgi:hypothetical protein
MQSGGSSIEMHFAMDIAEYEEFKNCCRRFLMYRDWKMQSGRLKQNLRGCLHQDRSFSFYRSSSAVLVITKPKFVSLIPDTSCFTYVTAGILQSSSLTDLLQWADPLAAIVMYTFDLSMLSKGLDQDKNFYFRLNKVVKLFLISFQCHSFVFVTEHY